MHVNPGNYNFIIIITEQMFTCMAPRYISKRSFDDKQLCKKPCSGMVYKMVDEPANSQEM